MRIYGLAIMLCIHGSDSNMRCVWRSQPATRKCGKIRGMEQRAQKRKARAADA